ncbi:MAG: gliding motility-associated C-terminal domain-containing protein [Bacteroidales bacterium]|nr:gliding motility-associated C-terminal domain-containing protein [Bacteroidales bacterium]
MPTNRILHLLIRELPVRVILLTAFAISAHNFLLAEGTRQMEPLNAPDSSYCRIALTQNVDDHRIPFALVNCSEDYRLLISVKDYLHEKIYLGFGSISDYYEENILLYDVKFQVKDQAGNVIPGFALQPLPSDPQDAGFISTRAQALAGPNISAGNPAGYTPLILTPPANGNYILEFNIPLMKKNEARIFKYFDVTVANGTQQINGRLWSKAWQFSSSSIDASEKATYASFFIYSNDSIVTRFNCNGLAGGIWAIYSNEWGTSTSGNWNERRRSIGGNASVRPEYGIFLNDPDLSLFPSGSIGQLLNFEVSSPSCDTAVTFKANVSKGGNLEVLLDLPPLNPGTTGPEDIQLGYQVHSGLNNLEPGWNGLNGLGLPVPNGTNISARIRFLNGLTNIPLYDVEDNPSGFKVDIQRPLPANGISKLKLYWDDTHLPPQTFPNSNTNGCYYTGTSPVSGCHEWTITQLLGDINTVNTWWYYSTDQVLQLSFNLLLKPTTAKLSGPGVVCKGQQGNFQSALVPFAEQYHWSLNGSGMSKDTVTLAPTRSWNISTGNGFPEGDYLLTVYASNSGCGNGGSSSMTFAIIGNSPPPISGQALICTSQQAEFNLPGLYPQVTWSSSKGKTISVENQGSKAFISWEEAGTDTITAVSSSDCGNRTSIMPVVINPSAVPNVEILPFNTSCPGMPISFHDHSSLTSGAIVSRSYDWGNGQTYSGLDTLLERTFTNEGSYPVKYQITTDKACVSEKIFAINIIPYPIASFTYSGNCSAQTTHFRDNSSGIELSSWKWTSGGIVDPTGSPVQGAADIIFNQTGLQTVSLLVSNKYGCRDTVTEQVMIHPPPQAAFEHELLCSHNQALFRDQSLEGDTSLYSYEWKAISSSGNLDQDSGKEVYLSFDEPGQATIQLNITDNFGCTDFKEADFEVVKSPEAEFQYFEIEGTSGSTLGFTNNSEDAASYAWDFSTPVTSNLAEPRTSFTAEGNYSIQLIVTNIEGCRDTIVKSYYFTPGTWIPNAFSPNADGLNDVFRPVSLRNTLSPYSLQVYNTWGQLIFMSEDPSRGWDGRYKGRQCEAADYFYRLRYRQDATDNQEMVVREGFVTLIR